MHRVLRRLALPQDSTAPTGKGVRVAILDTGIDPDHPDFRGRIDFDASDHYTAIHCDLFDRNGHGTHIAGIIGGDGSASNGLNRGIAPDATLLIYKIANKREGLLLNAVKAIESAVNAGAHIINYSHGHNPTAKIGKAPWVWPTERNILEEAFEKAAQCGVLCVVAAGNAGPDEGSITSPGGLDAVLTVGAIGHDGRVLEMSGRGPYRRSKALRPGGVTRFQREFHRDIEVIQKPDIVAPGQLISAPRSRYALDYMELLSDLLEESDLDTLDPDYAVQTGTSQATAVVSGLAACLLELVLNNRVDLGPNPVQALRRIFLLAGNPLPAKGFGSGDATSGVGTPPEPGSSSVSEQQNHTSAGDKNDAGEGLIIWPVLQSVLEDFVRDPQFRNVVLGDSLKLL